jgi:hypothetical protein
MSDQYRQNAFECVRLAQTSTNSECKVILLIMARAWIKLMKLSGERIALADACGAALGEP